MALVNETSSTAVLIALDLCAAQRKLRRRCISKPTSRSLPLAVWEMSRLKQRGQQEYTLLYVWFSIVATVVSSFYVKCVNRQSLVKATPPDDTIGGPRESHHVLGALR